MWFVYASVPCLLQRAVDQPLALLPAMCSIKASQACSIAFRVGQIGDLKGFCLEVSSASFCC